MNHRFFLNINLSKVLLNFFIVLSFADGINAISEETSWLKLTDFLSGIGGVQFPESIVLSFPIEKIVIRFFQGNTINTTNMIKAAKVIDHFIELQPQFIWMLTFIRRWFMSTEWFPRITDDLLQILLVVYLQTNNFLPKGSDVFNRIRNSKKLTPYVAFKGHSQSPVILSNT